MTSSVERLEPRLRDTALIILRRHHIGEDDLQLEANEPHEPPSCLIRGHRVNVHVDDDSAAFRVRSGRWSGRRADYPTAGAFLAAFEEALHGALSGA
ncbi:MAG: hypothetical protein KGL74_03725 [Elusimicrobia bacterium]|nr:hypothetical protein [Elusimicrobiota bacterium]MDE2510210.1 hypothetical protein [Elusimicrobiota bacterium]